MTLPAFDTHAYVKRLKAVGFDEKQAEVQAELQSEVLSALMTDRLATKDDLANLELVMKADITNLERALKDDMTNLERTLKDDMINLERAVKEDIAKVKQDVVRLESVFTGKFNLLNWMLGFSLVGVTSVLFKLFLHG